MAILSEPAFQPLFAVPSAGQDGNSPAWMSMLSARGGFTAEPRFAAVGVEAEPDADAVRDEALARAFAEGQVRGRALAEAAFVEESESRAALSLSLAQLDENLARELAQRLAETVAVLCEATLAPLALDRDMLERRCVAAAARVGEGVLDATLRLHPDDVALLDCGFASTWHILPDASLERGTVVFDMAEGAVIDGPGEWRDALREALGIS
jgi:flagellar assembly protein FliH